MHCLKAALLSVSCFLFALASHGTTGVSPVPGAVVAWGLGDQGQTSVPPGLTHVIAVAAGVDHSVALKSDGTVVAWGRPEACQIPQGLPPVKYIDAGNRITVGVLVDGTIRAWGETDGASFALKVPANLRNVIAVACSTQDRAIALKDDGTMVAWGQSAQYGNVNNIPIGYNSNVKAVAAGWFRHLALKEGGTVVGWGSNDRGEAIPPVGVNSAVATAAGNAHSLILNRDGSIVGWGWNAYGQASAPPSRDFTAISSGEIHNLALKADGTIFAWGGNVYGQASVPAGLSGVTAIAAGFRHSLAVQGYDPSISTKATATATISAGQVIKVGLIYPGSGYGVPPTVEFVGGGGVGARASAVLVDGMVARIEVTDGGGGYTSAPAVIITPPPLGPKMTLKVSRVQLQLDLQAGKKYFLESSPDLKGWVPVGAIFTAQTSKWTQEFEVKETGQYFRIKEVP